MTLGMYKLPKLINVPDDILLPDASVAYRMKPIVNLSSVFPGNSNKNCDEIQKLAARQNALLERLAKLQEKLNGMNGSQKISTKSSITGLPNLKNGVVHDIVIKASPLNAPYSVVPLVCSLREAGFHVYGNFMTHSTCKSAPLAIWPALISPSGEGRESHQISVTILWTDVEQPTLMVSPIHQVPIVGEVNIARYFSRLLPAHVAGCYESAASLSDIARTDALLDEFHMVLSGTLSKREMGQYMSQLERRFQSCSAKSALLQSVMWSALKRLIADGAKLPAAISQWVQSRDNQYIGSSNAATSNTATSSTVKSSQAKGQANSSGFKLTTKNDLLNLLTQLKIDHKCYEHKGVMTVAELLQEASFVSGVHMKNLFVRDKKKQLYLVSARHNAKVDMKSLATALGCKDLRFADHDILLSTLNISQGHVNAYAIINDEKRVVKLVLDDMVTSNRDQIVNFHPMVNSSSVSVKCGDLLKFFDHHGRKPIFVSFKDE